MTLTTEIATKIQNQNTQVALRRSLQKKLTTIMTLITAPAFTINTLPLLAEKNPMFQAAKNNHPTKVNLTSLMKDQNKEVTSKRNKQTNTLTMNSSRKVTHRSRTLQKLVLVRVVDCRLLVPQTLQPHLVSTALIVLQLMLKTQTDFHKSIIEETVARRVNLVTLRTIIT